MNKIQRHTNIKSLTGLKQRVLLSLCFIVFSCTCFAQDVIVTKDSKKINAKVTEVNVDNIRYKNFDNPDGPVYTLPKSDILTILYQNGQVETFETENPKPSASSVKDSEKYYSCLKQKPRELSAEMEANNPLLFNRYVSGAKMTSSGAAMIGTGIFVALGGVAVIAINPDNAAVGAIFLVAGSMITTAGIPIVIVGTIKKNIAIRNYCNQKYMSKSSMPRFQLNMHGNGAGLAFVF